ncbi:MAG: hypothetical protein ACWA5K_08295 [bacterium]
MAINRQLRRINRLAWIKSALLITGLSAFTVQAGPVYYRYLNEEGVQVIDYKVPPGLVHQGYDIITENGDLIRSVAAFDPDSVLSEEEIKVRDKQRLEEIRVLRSFSTLQDLHATRDRRVRALEGEIAALRNNVGDHDRLLQEEQAKAANIQREGVEVSDMITAHIETLTKQLADSRRMLVIRLDELEAMKKRYLRLERRFIELKGLGSDNDG